MEREAQMCNNLITVAGLPPGLTPEFEKHFMSNRKVVSFFGAYALEVGNIEYYDAPQGDMMAGKCIVPKRRMRWGQRLLSLPEDLPINEDLIELLTHDGYNDGLPLGIIPGTDARMREALTLGACNEMPYGTLINYRGGEIRVYDVSRHIKGRFEDLPGVLADACFLKN